MSSKGFILQEKEGHYILEYLCPKENVFFSARLFMRGNGITKAMGDPALSREAVYSLLKENSDKKFIAPQQVHGINILTEEDSFCIPNRPAADGLFLTNSCYEGSLRFADCVPVILASPLPRPWVLLLHSGYKGTVQNIAGNGLDYVAQKMDLDLKRVYAWIGPGISKEFYYRSQNDDWTTLGQREISSNHWQKVDERVYFDLPGAIETQLREKKLLEANITMIPFCSYRDSKYCYSYRKNDKRERMFLLASLSEKECSCHFHHSLCDNIKEGL
ncbi:MAG: polyphenol oxidase family protein [Aminobacterium sp.]|jgi:hypothetical protein|uniref:polyphenol oxidase family protein n=1 Tax=Aminobacterium sp. MB27-C1 TaxID=3070661 RepID=UPI001BD0AA6B|nr:polyphenol oxidase family protein [Aminobacterium sp. MB27-C1]MDD2207450.1 polyphenol oxidase family protein [Aminobacterium sp.]MDD4229209.1 polyphenol oxidase family protein [Aminobacterium sp.]MDD4552228.1 polyphenol oxidase family protein [Aminobacterium sp.]WMI72570.1 polyphenol oxidase family protein [Aminobacterium sp. MB27-C1]